MIVILTSLMNATSLASLWMTINQLQLFLLLLLIRAFIPIDIQTIIEGFDFASYAYGYIPLKQLNIYSHLISRFEFDLDNSSLEVVGIKYCSTIANIFTILIFTFLIILFTLSIFPIRLLLSNLRECQR